MTGHIQKRGASTWRLKFELDRDPATGERKFRQVTFHGNKRQAEAELTRLLAARDTGNAGEPDKITVAAYMKNWITTAETAAISPKTAERYKGLIENQIVPHLGAIPLQKLRGSHIATWHATLLREGGRGTAGKAPRQPLSASTVGHAHRVLHKALADAMKRELLFRNPADLISPPKVTTKEMKILDAITIKTMLEAMRETPIFLQVITLLATGVRRGELFGLQWKDLDLDGRKMSYVWTLQRRLSGKRWARTRSRRKFYSQLIDSIGVPKGNRTPVFAVKGDGIKKRCIGILPKHQRAMPTWLLMQKLQRSTCDPDRKSIRRNPLQRTRWVSQARQCWQILVTGAVEVNVAPRQQSRKKDLALFYGVANFIV